VADNGAHNCVICGLRKLKGKYNAPQFTQALKDLGIAGEWAHASCIVQASKLRAGLRRLQGFEDHND